MVQMQRLPTAAGVILLGCLALTGCSHQDDTTTPSGVTLNTGTPVIPAPKNAAEAAEQAKEHAAALAAQYNQRQSGQ